MAKLLSTPESRENFFDGIKGAYQDISDSRIAKGLRTLTKLGGKAVRVVVGGTLNYFGYAALRNPNLKIRQKILPIIGVTVGIVTIIPATIVGLVGASILIPPFTAVASIAGIFRNLTEYYQERTERTNLEKELIGKDPLIKKIDNSKLSLEEKGIVKDYATKHQNLYNALYSLRKTIIESGDSSGLTHEDKVDLIKQVNTAIESVYYGDNKPLMLKLPEAVSSEMRESIRVGTSVVNDHILQYREKTEQYSKIKLPSSLKSAVGKYKDLHEKIYAQDLPEKLKSDIIVALQRKKNSKQDIRDLFARIGNCYLNTTSEAQAKMLAGENRLNSSNLVQPKADFPAVNIKFNIKRNDPVAKVSRVVSRAIHVENAKAIAKGGVSKLKNGLVKQLFGSEGAAKRKAQSEQKRLLKLERKAMQSHFMEQYEPTFDALSKKERLAFLKKSTKRRLANVGIGFGTAALSITATALIASAATPAAPAALAGVAISAVGTAFTLGSVANSVHLGIQANQAEAKVDKPKREVTKAVTPNVPVKERKKVLSHYGNNLKSSDIDLTKDASLKESVEPKTTTSLTDPKEIRPKRP